LASYLMKARFPGKLEAFERSGGRRQEGGK
jgi:hypothetical protein